MKGKGRENVPGSRNRAGCIKAPAKFLWPEHRMRVRDRGGRCATKLQRWSEARLSRA